MITHDLLMEIGTEELPPKFLKSLSEDFCTLMAAQLSANKLSFSAIKSYATPRRIALVLTDVADTQENYTNERKGPPVAAAFKDNEPTQALLGFARSCGVALEALTISETEKGAWYTYTETVVGKATETLLPQMLTEALNKLPIAKRMRWANHDFEFVRPIRWLVLLFGDKVVEATIMGVNSDRYTQGHRFHAAKKLYIESPGSYEQLLATQGFVIADFNKRQQQILKQAQAVAAPFGRAIIDTALLDEVTALVEWPTALIGTFESHFLNVPQEALISTMQDNQKYFPIVDDKGALTEHFCFITNIESKDPSAVISGNERVIRPRFSDADFFWNSDKDVPLEDYLPRLDTTIFQTALGSQKAKTQRVAILAQAIAEKIGADNTKVILAARLYKSDLLSNMVQEFPELQGIMGRYYALNQNMDPVVAAALEEVYWPKFAGDKLPQTKEAQALAIAERIDTLCGIFAIGQIPSGSRDPFSLRRNALGVLRMLIEAQLDLDLKTLIDLSVTTLPKDLQKTELTDQVLHYVIERMRALTSDLNIPGDSFEAVMALKCTAPLEIHQRLNAVTTFKSLSAAPLLIQSNKRIHNILQKNLSENNPALDPSLLEAPEEQALYNVMNGAAANLEQLMAAHRYEETLRALTTLAEPLEAFFENVMVMCDDAAIKANRLALLNKLNHYFRSVADLSLLQA